MRFCSTLTFCSQIRPRMSFHTSIYKRRTTWTQKWLNAPNSYLWLDASNNIYKHNRSKDHKRNNPTNRMKLLLLKWWRDRGMELSERDFCSTVSISSNPLHNSSNRISRQRWWSLISNHNSVQGGIHSIIEDRLTLLHPKQRTLSFNKLSMNQWYHSIHQPPPLLNNLTNINQK